MGTASGSRGSRRSALLALSLLGCASSSPPLAPAPSPEKRPVAAPAPAATDSAPPGVPRLRLEADRVLIDDQDVAPLERRRPERIDLLSDAMKARRSEQPSGPPYQLTVAAEVNGAQLKSAVQTSAAAGWPVALLGLGERSLALHATVPGPPGTPMYSDLSWPEETLVIVVRTDSVELMRAKATPPPAAPDRPFDGETPEASEAHLPFENEPSRRIGEVAADNVTSGVPELVRTACEKGRACNPAVLIVADEAPFSLVDGALKALVTLPLEHAQFDVQLRIKQPATRPEAPGTLQPVAGGIGPTQSGRLAPELIQKTIRASSDQFQKCYEAGLARDPKLTGRIYVRFVIGRDGKVARATTGTGSTLPDARVTQCVVRHFRNLQFPQPEGGIVTVTYPLQLPLSE